MSRIIRTALALALFAPLATACDTGEELDSGVRAVENFEDGMICDSDQGAFRVTLWSDSGDIEVGANNLIVRLGMFDPNDIEGAGKGIPGANIDLDAWMPTADEAMDAEPTVEYIGDGQYRFENVVLTDEGVWNFDFSVAVGQNMQESISLAFSVD